MLRTLFFTTLMISTLTSCRGVSQPTDSRPVQHDAWTKLLQKHVGSDGNVDYKGFVEDSAALNDYLDLLSAHHPNAIHWTPDERMAYWINAYNAFTVKLIVDHYPVESIKDIKRGLPMVNSVWDIKFIEIQGQKYDLNNIEHGILRKEFEEPRIHFAVNCASVSCPVLRNEAFTAEKLEQQLAAQTRAFLLDTSKNRITPKSAEVSKIFSWFKGDFTKGQSLQEFLAKHSGIAVSDDADISYDDYDWGLNE